MSKSIKYCPRVEVLEDRAVPSTLRPGLVAAPGNGGLSFRSTYRPAPVVIHYTVTGHRPSATPMANLGAASNPMVSGGWI